MSFICNSHGWSHLLNPCPLCPTFYRYSTTSTEALVGVTSIHYDDLRARLSAAEKERDELKAKLAVTVEALKTMSSVTYGTELCNSDEENNEILANNFFRHQKIAEEALKAINGGE